MGMMCSWILEVDTWCLLHRGCRVVVAIDQIAGDTVVIDEWGLDDLGTGNHHGLLHIDRLLDDDSCGSRIGRTGDCGSGREAEERPSEAIWDAGSEPASAIAVTGPSTTWGLIIPPASTATVGTSIAIRIGMEWSYGRSQGQQESQELGDAPETEDEGVAGGE